MDYYCEACDKFVEPKSKNKHFKSNVRKEFDKCKHLKLTIENFDINKVDRTFYEYIIQHNKKI